MHAPEEYVRQFDHLPEDRRIMAAMIKAMDDGVALVLGTLERMGLRDNTIVFMSSDNGPSVEERNWLNGEEVSYTGGSAGGLRGHKGSLFEGGIRVPGIISWPAGLPAGVELESPGLMMDLLPTVLEAVDGRPVEDESIDGRSLLAASAAGRNPSAASPLNGPRWTVWRRRADGLLGVRGTARRSARPVEARPRRARDHAVAGRGDPRPLRPRRRPG